MKKALVFYLCLLGILAMLIIMSFPFSNRDNLGAAKQRAWDSQEPCDTEEFFAYRYEKYRIRAFA